MEHGSEKKRTNSSQNWAETNYLQEAHTANTDNIIYKVCIHAINYYSRSLLVIAAAPTLLMLAVRGAVCVAAASSSCRCSSCTCSRQVG